MGQYFKFLNLTRKEQIQSWGFSTAVEEAGGKIFGGAKFLEISWNFPELWMFLLRQSDGGGGGDVHESYNHIGRWAGDKVTLIGDYDSSKLWSKSETWTDIGTKIASDFVKFHKEMGKDTEDSKPEMRPDMVFSMKG